MINSRTVEAKAVPGDPGLGLAPKVVLETEARRRRSSVEAKVDPDQDIVVQNPSLGPRTMIPKRGTRASLEKTVGPSLGLNPNPSLVLDRKMIAVVCVTWRLT